MGPMEEDLLVPWKSLTVFQKVNLGKLFKQQMNLFCLKLHCYKINKLIDCSSVQEKEILILVSSHQLYSM